MRSNYLPRVAALAALYVLTGKIGLLLAVPPGYATIIWPASGIALGMLIMQGARLWPGVLIGSFLLNAWNSGAFVEPALLSPKLAAAFCIAIGSTLQALTGRALIARIMGLPLRLGSVRHVLWLLGIGGPLNCVIAATVGVGTLWYFDIVSLPGLAANWLAWWSGDTLGVLVFMPLVLLAPGAREQLTWRGTSIGRLPLASLLLLLLPLGLTFYAWKAAAENDYQRGQAKFHAIALESEKALQNRIASYGNALLGAAGFMQGSEQVSRAEWRTYVETIQVRENFHGLHGLGWIEPLARPDVDAFERAARAEGARGFTVHPARDGPAYVIRYIEPESDNRPALGLDIAYEAQRRAAAERARDTGQPAMTGRLTLVQDAEHSVGFLLLFPIYQRDVRLGTVEARRAALRGWTYAPFIAHNSLDGLTHSQDVDLGLRIYDGTEEKADALLYASASARNAPAAFTTRTRIPIMQRTWLVVCESTPGFETRERSTNPLYILVGGLLFTALLALLLIVIAVRRTEHIEQMVGERRFAVPLLVFLVIVAGSIALYSRLRSQELGFVLRQVQEEASKAGALLRAQAADRVAALRRMAARWDETGGTRYELWRHDAGNLVEQLAGLRAIEWIDADYQVRWVVPMEGNESAIGLNVLSDARRAADLRGAAGRQQPTLTPPMKVVQGYSAFIAYVPLRRNGKFDGFVAGIYSISDFFHSAMRTELSRNYSMSILHDGVIYFADDSNREHPPASWVTETTMRIQDQPWTLRIAPTIAYVESQKSGLPALVLVAGLLVAALSALSVRYILISRLKSAHLAKSLALNAGIISSSAHLVIAIDDQYRIVNFNRAAELALGYRAADVIGHRAIPIFLDPAELEERARTLSAELGEQVPVGPGIFTRIPLRDGVETREWTFVRRDGTRFPANVTITPLRDATGALTGYLGVIEDITVRKEVEKLKSEFTAVVSHELRTPLTSIRGSLGLILGALASSLQPKVRDLLEIAQTNCERLVLLVNDILDMEKFSAGQMRFEFRNVPLAGLVQQAVDANEGYARKFQVRIEAEPLDAAWRVSVDPDRFIQVMSNLLSNAAKYSPAGGAVRIHGQARGDRVRVSVHDDGPGIPESFRDRIFEKFSQADASTTREKGGTGLGLHIARRFIEHMHGHIGFESEPGRGSTFWIELPVAGNGAAAGPPAATSTAPAG
jgi:PAS domain S-box-containing protein